MKSLTEFFCMVNPDIRLTCDPFFELIACFDNENIGLVAPLVVSPEQKIEDSDRRFPTSASILAKAMGIRNFLDYDQSLFLGYNEEGKVAVMAFIIYIFCIFFGRIII